MTARPVPFAATSAGRLCILLALAKVALELPILRRYGWHRDELYFLAAGRHLALGYVDFPPLTAVAARLVDGVFGPSLIVLRLVSALLAAVAAVATGAIARELGATPRVQVLATAAWLATPFGLSGGVLFHPTFLDFATTAMAALAATRLVVRGDPRQWLVLGLWGGIGLEAKYTIVVPLAAFLAGCALWRRDLLRRREAGAGVLITAGLLVPNAVWQVGHDWVSLDFASSQRARTASDSPPLVYGDRSFWKDELGWRELTAQTARAWRSRTPAERAAGAIVAGDYGVAGALSLYGPAAGLPQPVSGHLTFQYWHPARMPQRSVLLVGFDREDALAHCTRATVLGVADNRWHVGNEERGRPLVWCRLRAPLGQIWQESFATAHL